MAALDNHGPAAAVPIPFGLIAAVRHEGGKLGFANGSGSNGKVGCFDPLPVGLNDRAGGEVGHLF
jgi:hypothetical protein